MSIVDQIKPQFTDEDHLLLNALAEIEQLREENKSLAAWSCIHVDGKTGIFSDEHGNQHCAKDKEIERLRKALKRIAEYDTDENWQAKIACAALKKDE